MEDGTIGGHGETCREGGKARKGRGLGEDQRTPSARGKGKEEGRRRGGTRTKAREKGEQADANRGAKGKNPQRPAPGNEGEA